MSTLLLFVSLTLSLTAHADEGDNANLQQLLNQADRALGESRAPSATPRPKKAAAPRRPAVAEQKRPARWKDPEAQTSAGPTELSPMQNSEVQEILSVDLGKRRQELNGLDSKTTVRLGFGQDTLSGDYALTKDQDVFRAKGNATLFGGYVQFSPSWPLDWFRSGSFRTRFVASLAGGFFNGDVPVVREGVQTGSYAFSRYLIPIDGEVGFSLAFNRWFSLDLLYGLSLELLHQSGGGDLESTNQAFWGDGVSLGPKFQITDSLDVLLRLNRRGLFLKSANPISGFMATIGLGFAFSG